MTRAVLIVDDEDSILQALRRTLRRDEYDLHLASDGETALRILDEIEVAVLICDQRMPGMSGAEVLAEAYRRRPNTIRITLTGHTDMAAVQASINEGHIQHFLLKPWDDSQLRTIVRDSMHSYELVTENQRLAELTGKQQVELEAWNEQLEEQVRQRTDELRARNDQLQDLQRRVELSLRDTVGVLADVLEAHNPNMALHSKRVSKLAKALAQRLNITGTDLRDVEFAARLHDIGRISKISQPPAGGVTAHAPNAPAAKSHRHSDTATAHAILSRVGGFNAVALGIRHQHDPYDGGASAGAVVGLEQDAIPLCSRIIAIVNAYDEAAYTTANPTKPDHDLGRRVLRQDHGRRYDPALVASFIAYLDEVGTDDCGDAEAEVSPKDLITGMCLSRALHNAEGVLLIKPGTTLTDNLIAKIRELNNIDPLLNSVFVRSTLEASADDESQDEPVPAVPLPNTPSPPHHGLSKRRALIVDDDCLVCNALTRELRRAGWASVCLDNGRAAQNLLEDESFDLLLVDVCMPVMTGDMLVSHVLQCWPEMPCIVLTGHANQDQLLRISKATNVKRVLAKPWDSQELLELMNSAVPERPEKPMPDAV